MSDPTDGWPAGDWPSDEWPSEDLPSGQWPAGDLPAGEWPSGDWPSENWRSEGWLADDRPAGRGRHGRARASGGQRSLLVRYRWYGALLAGVAAAALATGAIILMNSHDGRLVANGCGMVSCSAALPGSTSAGALPQASPRGTLTARPAPAHHPAAVGARRSPRRPRLARARHMPEPRAHSSPPRWAVAPDE